MVSNKTLTAGFARAHDVESAPRSWAYHHKPETELRRLKTPSLQLQLADPLAYLQRHEAALGHNARNVINIAPEVGYCSCAALQQSNIVASSNNMPCGLPVPTLHRIAGVVSACIDLHIAHFNFWKVCTILAADTALVPCIPSRRQAQTSHGHLMNRVRQLRRL